MTEQQYPIHLRKIGEHQIAEFLETLIIELDTHEKMFLELCQVTRERDALLAATRHGHWIDHPDDLYPEESYIECSECHAEVCGYALDEENYYPTCGAKMDAESDAVQEAPTVDAVPREEHESLLKRFRHLLESDFIRSFDEYDPKTGTYKRDISEADTVAQVIRCKDCEMWGRSPWGPSVLGWCKLHGEHRKPDYFCASAERRGAAKEVKSDG